MAYEIWRDDSLNLSGAFNTREEALEAVRQAVSGGGEDVVRRSFLARSGRGTFQVVAEGADLIALAYGSAPAPVSRRKRAAA